MNSIAKRWPMRSTLTNFVLILGMLGVLPACQATRAPSSQIYRPVMPEFLAQPVEYPCTIVHKDGNEMEMACLKVLKNDLYNVVRELRAACLALGWSETDCQVTGVDPKVRKMRAPSPLSGVDVAKAR
jgi:hypothetical protein